MINNSVVGTLVLLKSRFEVFQKAIQHHEKIEIIKEYTDENGEECVHFHIEVTSVISLLFVFHAGIELGSESMAKALINK
jgi:hypothetical protein